LEKHDAGGQVSKNLVDVTDFYPTFAELAGAPLPAGVKIDGRSLAPQVRGQRGKPRDWVFVMLEQKWYVRDARWKLNNEGQLFDMTDAPFKEVLVRADSADAKSARARLQAALDELQPQAAIVSAGTRKKAKEGGEEEERVIYLRARRTHVVSSSGGRMAGPSCCRAVPSSSLGKAGASPQ
jgi:arylsulfatase A-like enzyme